MPATNTQATLLLIADQISTSIPSLSLPLLKWNKNRMKEDASQSHASRSYHQSRRPITVSHSLKVNIAWERTTVRKNDMRERTTADRDKEHGPRCWWEQGRRLRKRGPSWERMAWERRDGPGRRWMQGHRRTRERIVMRENDEREREGTGSRSPMRAWSPTTWERTIVRQHD